MNILFGHKELNIEYSLKATLVYVITIIKRITRTLVTEHKSYSLEQKTFLCILVQSFNKSRMELKFIVFK